MHGSEGRVHRHRGSASHARGSSERRSVRPAGESNLGGHHPASAQRMDMLGHFREIGSSPSVDGLRSDSISCGPACADRAIGPVARIADLAGSSSPPPTAASVGRLAGIAAGTVDRTARVWRLARQVRHDRGSSRDLDSPMTGSPPDRWVYTPESHSLVRAA
jgi:hypothetical protein